PMAFSIRYLRDHSHSKIQDDFEQQKMRRIKAADVLKKLVATKSPPFLEGKIAEEICTILKQKLQNILPMSQLDVIRKACLKRISDFSDASQNYNAYDSSSDGICSMLHLIGY
ncbi:hypothetical protein MMC22_011767, partial [Lobaria immixta]|nr:hypothetical protein [Lobaria immixta]